jgi:serine/threonine protein kinase/tetratricopeptide (TPR) repeat protein
LKARTKPILSEAAMSERDLFIAALKITGLAERSAWLDRECGGDAALRQRIEVLLQAFDKAGSLLENPAVANGPTTGEPITERPGTVIGPYKLIEPIGEGGMGTVFLAQQQEPVKRLVALKIIKPGMDSRLVLARFEAERQALALMDHPNIAKVLDAGATPAGRPYFVMELVKGVPITRYCDDKLLTPKDRLDLFVQVCHAVQHAHQKGVIHRDLKPSNVLVAPYDGKPVVKVIDFGVVKAAGQPLTERTLVTGLGAVVGTPEYMSPEQAELNNADIDTRSDVYSLGVLLYELLTGTTPLTAKRVKEAGLLEVLRVIREEEPQKPSTRLSTTEELPSIAARRSLEPKKLSGLVRGELDWIVMKSLEKDRNRRYETANELARDIENYLHDEPVLAGPPSARYRLRKFVQRNRGPVLAAGTVLLALVGGVVGTTAGLVQAKRAEANARDEAGQKEIARAGEERQRFEAVAEKNRAVQAEQATKAQAEITRAVNGFLLKDLLGQADIGNQAFVGEGTERNPKITVGELLDRAAKAIQGKFADQPLTEAAVRLTVGDAYRALGRYAEAEPHLERSVRLRTVKLGADHPDTLASMNNLAVLYLRQGKYDTAEHLFQKVIDAQTAQFGADHPDTLRSKNNLTALYQLQGKYDQVERLYKEVLDAQTSRLGADHPDTLGSKNNLAVLYRAQGKFRLAEPLYKEVLDARTARQGADHPDTLNSKNNLAMLYRFQGKYGQAEALFRNIIEIQTARQGADHPATLISKHNLAVLYRLQGQYERAEPLLKAVLETRTASLAADHPALLRTKNDLALLYQAQRQYDRAAPLFREAVAGARQKLRLAHPNTQSYIRSLVGCYEQMGQPAKAEPLLRELAHFAKENAGADSLPYATQLAALGFNLLLQTKGADAETVLRESLTIRRHKEPDGWPTFHAQSLLGDSLLIQTKYADAEPFLVQGYEGMKQREDKIPADQKARLTEALQRLVRLSDARGNKDQAAAWRKKLEQQKEKQSPGPP